MDRDQVREWAIIGAITALLILMLYSSLYWASITPRSQHYLQPPAPPARTPSTVVTEMCSVLPRTADEASRTVLAEWIVKSSDQLPATLPSHMQTCLAQARNILRS